MRALLPILGVCLGVLVIGCGQIDGSATTSHRHDGADAQANPSPPPPPPPPPPPSPVQPGPDLCFQLSGQDQLIDHYRAKAKPMDPAILDKMRQCVPDLSRYAFADLSIYIPITDANEIQCLQDRYVYRLEADIDFQGAALTKARDYLLVALDGNGHTISNYAVNENAGSLFGAPTNSILMDMKMAHITGSIKPGYGVLTAWLAPLTNWMMGGAVCGAEVTDAKLSGVIDPAVDTDLEKFSTVAGLIAQGVGESSDDNPAVAVYKRIDGIVKNVTVTASVEGKGGLGGVFNGIENISGGNITAHVTVNRVGASTVGNTGGLASSIQFGSFSNVAVDGIVHGSNEVGGLVGVLAMGSQLSYATFSGDVSGTLDVGGAVGYLYSYDAVPGNAAKLSGVRVSGKVSGTKNVGGLIGTGSATGITNSSSDAEIVTLP